MTKLAFRRARASFWFLLALTLAHQSASAHIVLDSPNGGELLSGGFFFPIDWHPAVQHSTENWDLWYSTTSSTGPWIEIATDLPLGDPSADAPHTYNWYVPNTNISQAWIRVRQDNTGQDYFDVSNSSVTIAAALAADYSGNSLVNGEDLLIWENNFGTSSGALFLSGDGDGDGDVDGSDFLLWQQNQASGIVLTASTIPVPEPPSLFLILIGMVVLLMLQRRNSAV